MKVTKEMILGELSNESEMVLSTAYLYAKNFDRYGEDITKAWITAIQQKVILEKAYNLGYSDALKSINKSKKELE